MNDDSWMSLERLAESAVPAGDPYSVASTGLPAAKASQDRRVKRLAGRVDRFSRLLARSTAHQFDGDNLVGQSALSESERAEMLGLAATATAAFKDELAALMLTLRDLVRPLDPMLVAAQISFNHTTGAWGRYFEPTNEGSEVAVETVAGVIATQGPTARDRPTSAQIQAVEDLLTDLSDIRLLLTMSSAFAADDVEAGYLRMIGSAHMAAVRGDCYAHHGRDLALAIFSPIQSWMLTEFGFDIHEFYAVADAAIDLRNTRVNEHLRTHVNKLNAFRVLGDDITDDEKVDAVAVLDSMFGNLPDELVFTALDLVEPSGLELGKIQTVLQTLSVSVGELDESRYRDNLDETPFLRTPFLRDADRFLLPVAGHLVRSSNDLFEGRLLKRFLKFSRHRAAVVDKEAVSLLAQALPGATAGTSLHYRFDDGEGLREYETDGVLLFENYCLIVEGKANALSTQAQRGDIARLRRDIGKSLEESWHQCARVERYIRSNTPAVFTDSKGVEVLRTSVGTNSVVLHINPMLHSLGVFAHEVPMLRSLGLFPAGTGPWPVLVTDLRVIVEMLTSPAELLHYIEWRMSLPIGDGITAVDELDIYGAYLFGRVGRTNLDAGHHMVFGNSTTDFDAYYAGEQGTGPVTSRPHRVLGDFLERTLTELAETRPNEWIHRSFAILDLPLTEAAELEAFSETLALEEIGDRRWLARRVGESIVVAIAADTAITDVLLDIAQQTPAAKRQFIVHLGRRPRLIASHRNRMAEQLTREPRPRGDH